MPNEEDKPGREETWAHFRFGVIGPLLAAPPDRGELRQELEILARKKWRHPVTAQWVQFGLSTIERWYYRALGEPKDPVGVLGRKIRQDCGTHPSLSAELRGVILEQYRQHPNWSYQLHADNLTVLVAQVPTLGAMPSYPSVRRFMQAHGLLKRPRRGRGNTAGVEAAEKRFEGYEIRSYESQYANALWHLDFHHGSLKVLLPDGQWAGVQLLGVLDDYSRLCIHAQWYLAETAENLVHGLCQGFEKRGLPRALMSDNGAAMTASETVQGLQRLSIVHERTLPYSAYQNGKQEVLWAQAEGRLLAMLENCKDLTLSQLNVATIAWIDLEYNRTVHSETGQTPLARFVGAKDVGRPCPESEQLRHAFTAELSRMQRQSDGTISVESVRFELPSRYRHLKQVTVRFASWDLSHVFLADPRSGRLLCRLYPQDKHKNAEGRRRSKQPLIGPVASPAQDPEGGMAPLLRKLIAEYAATGLPPAYLPKDECLQEKEGER
ncbi:MAG: DDE-type integrase/transposase/recombinase [Thermodesulfobacteriota bacterium]